MKKYWRSISVWVFLFAVLGVCSGCYTMGKNFEGTKVQTIENGKTTKNDLVNMFGAPESKGVDNGMETWTFSYYKFHLIGMETWTKDLKVGFDKSGVVRSYTYDTSFPPSY